MDWATALREQATQLLGRSVEQMGPTQRIAHILKCLHLLDECTYKRELGGMLYAVDPAGVRDMICH